MKHNTPYRLIITGGGTAGHLFPALTIAHHFKELYPTTEILFVGAKGRMEMTQVPKAGFDIVGISMSGLNRKRLLPNLILPFRLLLAILKAVRILSEFKPNIVIGTGGYVSAPIAIIAGQRNIPVLLQEQNSYAGLANKLIARKAKTICVAYLNMNQYFPKNKVVLTGNPVKSALFHLKEKKQAALDYFSLDTTRRTLLIIGGSLGARTLNQSVLCSVDQLIEERIQVLWQTGKTYYDDVKEKLAHKNLEKIKFYDFIQRMDLAYAVSDIVISRSGALTISELCAVGKAAILVPSPNVTEDHQTKNAQALVNEGAVIMVPDHEAPAKLIDQALQLLKDRTKTKALSERISQLGKPNAAHDIVREIEKLLVCN